MLSFRNLTQRHVGVLEGTLREDELKNSKSDLKIQRKGCYWIKWSSKFYCFSNHLNHLQMESV